jgi:hypothetical protein
MRWYLELKQSAYAAASRRQLLRYRQAVRTRRYIPPSSTLHLTNSYHCSCAVPIPMLCYAILC